MTLFNKNWSAWLRDILLGGVLISVALSYQSSTLIERDGTVYIPNTELQTLMGETVNLFEEDKQTLVYFFAPWCQVCHLSIGNLEYVDPSKVNVVRIALDFDDVSDVRTFAQQHEITAPILLGNPLLKRTFEVSAYPSYYIVNKEQMIIGGTKGYSTAVGLKLRAYFLPN